jgi:hypothetical protein
MNDLALDLSNYSSPITASAMSLWQSNGVKLAIIQCLNPPPGYPAGQTRAQLQACQDAGLPVDIYFFLFAGQSPTTIQAHLGLANGFRIRRKWLDIEEPGLSVRSISQALVLLDAYPSLNQSSGIYSARWWAASNPGILDHFSASRDLWCAQYDNIADASIFNPFSGWSNCRIKQYRGTSTFGGVTSVDINVLSTSEAATLPNQGGTQPVAIIVGEGMANQLAANADQPLCDHVNYTQTDDEGKVYQVEKVLGSKGAYVSSNASGTWVNAGPI